MLLKALTDIPGVSGDEGLVREFIVEKIKDYVDEISVDSMGNLLCLKKGTGKSNQKVMVAAHMDEIGFIISKICDDGFLKFKSVGGIDPRVMVSKKVSIGEKGVPGVIGAKAIHLQKKGERDSVPKESELYIDIGARDKEHAEELISLGDYCVFDSSYVEFGDGFIKAKALDDRLGCAMMLSLAMEKEAYPFDLYLAFTVQEEVGTRGAKIITNRISPDVAIVLEGTTCSDVEGCEERDYSTVAGEGAVLSIIDRGTYYNKELVSALCETAKANDIPVQYKKTATGGNDAAAIHLSTGGVRVAAISVPARYIHSSSSVVKKSDYQAAHDLVHTFLREGITL